MTTEKEEVTPWFPGSVRPRRKGLYERRYDSGDGWYSYWNGRTWSLGFVDLGTAFYQRDAVSTFQHLPWRGRPTPPATPANAKGSK